MVDRNNYLIELSEELCPLICEAPLSELSAAEQVFVCVYELEREVNNGGFDQFLRNSAGQYAKQAAQALRVIGASSMADITSQAVERAFPNGIVPEDGDVREGALDDAGDDLEEALGEIDRRFYRYPDNLTDLLFEYVQEHRESIRGAKPA